MRTTKSDELTIKKATFTDRQTLGDETRFYTYSGYTLRGRLNGQRIRKQFRTHSEALTEKNRLEVEVANADGLIRAINTRLDAAQVRAAELAFDRIGEHSLRAVVDWFLAHYRPPLLSTPIETAAAEFMRDREREVSVHVVVDYRKVVRILLKRFPARALDTISTAEIETVMDSWGQSNKSWNNLRTYLHAFFEFCGHPSRLWVATNPIKAIRRFELARGIPHVMSVARLAEMFAFLETYAGPPRSGHKAGYLVPYFALATFAGIRPSIRDGELRKIHECADKDRIVDLKVGVIRITPEIAKTNDLRQITIQPNLAAWLKRFPIAEHPLITRNMMDQAGIIRKRFGLTHDVLRHTFISMHVAKFKSLGAAALEAGNSEAIIKKHYFNLVTAADAEKFWGIVPRASIRPDGTLKAGQGIVDTIQAL